MRLYGAAHVKENHSIYHDPGNGHFSAGEYPSHPKASPTSLACKAYQLKHLGFPLGIQRGRWTVPLLRVNRPYSVSFGNNLLCVQITYRHL